MLQRAHKFKLGLLQARVFLGALSTLPVGVERHEFELPALF
jgi:hypothetical protein